jgi:hypothetical protein
MFHKQERCGVREARVFIRRAPSTLTDEMDNSRALPCADDISRGCRADHPCQSKDQVHRADLPLVDGQNEVAVCSGVIRTFFGMPLYCIPVSSGVMAAGSLNEALFILGVTG